MEKYQDCSKARHCTMDMKEAMAYIKEAELLGSSLGLEVIRTLLSYMGDPQKKVRILHVAGTNGKGSVAAYLSAILAEAGYRVGRFISPELHDFTERISINGVNIARDEMARLIGVVSGYAELMASQGVGKPTVFEISTAMAFQYFFEQRCDLAVMEVGLGGRLDATNVIDCSLASIITSIGLDHMQILGKTLQDITQEKAGIIKGGGEVISAPQMLEAERVLKQICREKDAKLFLIKAEKINTRSYGRYYQHFDFGGYQNLQIRMLGLHQIINASVAVDTVLKVLNRQGFPVREDALRRGLWNMRWPGRLELLQEEPMIIVDGAHNQPGAECLAAGLLRHFPGKRFVFLVGVLRDKAYKDLFDALLPIASRFVTVTPPGRRALPAQDLAAYLSECCPSIPVEAASGVEAGLNQFVSTAKYDEALCAFGSLYYIDQVRVWCGKD